MGWVIKRRRGRLVMEGGRGGAVIMILRGGAEEVGVEVGVSGIRLMFGYPGSEVGSG